MCKCHNKYDSRVILIATVRTVRLDRATCVNNDRMRFLNIRELRVIKYTIPYSLTRIMLELQQC